VIHPSSIVAESGGDILASALRLFHGLFSRLEENGVIVRDFPQASDNNIWVFAHLLEAVRDAHCTPEFQRRLFDHDQWLAFLSTHLTWLGLPEAAEMVRSSFQPCIPADADRERLCRLGHMRRMLDFAMALADEINGKGIWPPGELLEPYRDIYRQATLPGTVPCNLLDATAMASEISGTLEGQHPEAARIVRELAIGKRRR